MLLNDITLRPLKPSSIHSRKLLFASDIHTLTLFTYYVLLIIITYAKNYTRLHKSHLINYLNMKLVY